MEFRFEGKLKEISGCQKILKRKYFPVPNLDPYMILKEKPNSSQGKVLWVASWEPGLLAAGKGAQLKGALVSMDKGVLVYNMVGTT